MKITRQVHATLAAALLAGCVAPATGPTPKDAALPPLPEAVIAAAAPWQDLSTARLRPEDGCYWYEHDGQVERTLLPLRTPEGRPICTSAG
ncbi:MAG: hypothetical protein U1E06_14815 [Tabrizicola sp.]|uniref:hypothetical protein n=1 Tax=Tabrizicola sp. TaxID=2005166 RepID=UPI0027329857|nr:hypothetical protein [Tabrizicola sp.]MDP3265035.1 hypothetical protein [Tabrizicola sp.]MDP3647422.1 hypothetical protein [Paracoccaceae bacterium]MDZ4068096.1 hypothetical protein [Tabrizicola sp.]